MIQECNKQIKLLEDKINTLISLYNEAKDKIENLTKEKEEKEVKIKKLTKEKNEIENKYNNLKIGKAIEEVSENKDAKDKLSKMIREIDNCIALLNK